MINNPVFKTEFRLLMIVKLYAINVNATHNIFSIINSKISSVQHLLGKKVEYLVQLLFLIFVTIRMSAIELP